MAIRFNIPEIGDRLILVEDWTFNLHHEYRNESLFEVLGMRHNHNWRDEPHPAPHEVTLPKGTILTVDRIYIRKGAKEFSSITFNMPGRKTTKRTETRRAVAVGMATMGQVLAGGIPPSNERQEFEYTFNIPSRGVRFWAKIADVHRIVFEALPKEVKRG